MLAVALIAAAGAILLYLGSRPPDEDLAAAPASWARFRGPVGYPALPPVMTARARRSPRTGAAPATRAPSVARLPTTAETLDLPLRQIASDTSLLEVSYRPFAEACLGAGSDAGSGSWLVSLKTAALRPGVTLRHDGATLDCESARQRLVARADSLKSELDAAERLAHASGVLPGQWRQWLATYELEAWGRY